MWRRLFLVLVGLAVTACAAATTPSARAGFGSAGRDVITAAEIVAAQVVDVYQAVAHLRPEFLRRRAVPPVTAYSAPTVMVFLDDLPLGDVEALRQIPLERVRLIRYLHPNEVSLRYGGSQGIGAILVTTLKK